MLEDTVKSIKAYLYDRTSSPLFGAFITSWVLWNHRFVMAIVFGDGLQEKYDMMDKAICASFLGLLSQWLILPLTTALLYIFLYPWPARWIYSYSKKQQMKINQLKNEIEGNRLLTFEESSMISLEIEALKEEYQRESEKLNLTITTLRTELKKAEKAKSHLISQQNAEKDSQVKNPNEIAFKPTGLNSNSSVDTTKQEYNETELMNKILLLIGIRGNLTKTDAQNRLGIESNIFTDYLFDKLESRGFINLVSDSQITLSKTGREYLVKNKLISQ